MKKNTLQKSVALALTGAMVMGTMTGCGSSAEAPAKDTASTETKTETAATTETKTETKAEEVTTEAVAGIEGYTAFADTVTLKIPVYDRGKEGVPAIGTGDNYWEKWIQENFADQYNIKMEFVPIARGGVLEAYNLFAASEDLPTILMEYDYPKQAQWVADGFLQTYDLEEFAQIAPTYYNRMVEQDQIKYTTKKDEKYFALEERPYDKKNYKYINFV